MQALEKIFPQKTALAIAERVGDGKSLVNDIRNAERWLAGTEPRAAELVQLLQSDVGREVLIALMGSAQPKWWRGFARNLEISELLRRQAETARAIEKLQREGGE